MDYCYLKLYGDLIYSIKMAKNRKYNKKKYEIKLKGLKSRKWY